MGDPAGIGGEISLSAWKILASASDYRNSFFLIDDPDRLGRLAEILNVNIPVVEIASPEDAPEVFQAGLPVCPVGRKTDALPGKLNPKNNEAVLESIRKAVEWARNHRISGVVTNPIHKGILMESGFGYPGHTEYLAHLCEAKSNAVMMLACPGLRVVPVTIHCSLREAIDSLTTNLIVETGKVVAKSLTTDFALSNPTIAVAGLNPHAGENGNLGDEDEQIVRPAVARLRQTSIEAYGPEPSDSLFHATGRDRFDACLCMYHDQALIPLKTIDFENGVNITLGLDIVRTSPDHGTALPLAGKGTANPSSLIAAIRTATEIARNRSKVSG